MARRRRRGRPNKTLAEKQAQAPTQEQIDRVVRIESAPNRTDIYDMLGSRFVGNVPNEDYLLKTKTAGANYTFPFGLYLEAIDKDPTLKSALSQRMSAVLKLPRVMKPADDSDRALEAANFHQAVLDNIGLRAGDAGFQKDLREMMSAIALGISFGEVMWAADEEISYRDTDGEKQKTRRAYVPVDIRSRHPRRFEFTQDLEPRLLTEERQTDGLPLEPFKWIIFRPYARFEAPYGVGELRTVWWSCWFKRIIKEFWLHFTEKFAEPTVLVTTDRTLTAAEKTDIKNAIDSIQHDTGLLMPKGVEVAFREAQRYGSISSYQQFIEYLDQEIMRSVLGQEMTLAVPERGARSLGEVQAQALNHITVDDARALEATINGSLIRWVHQINMPDYPMPRFEIDTTTTADRVAEMQLISQALAGGIDVSARFVYDRLRLPRPKDDSDSLKIMAAKFDFQADQMFGPQRPGEGRGTQVPKADSGPQAGRNDANTSSKRGNG